MEIERKYPSFDGTKEDLQVTLDELSSILPVENIKTVRGNISFSAKVSSSQQSKMYEIYEYLLIKQELAQLPDNFVQDIAIKLDKLADIFFEDQPRIAMDILHLRLAWDDQSPHAWYELAKLRYYNFIRREMENHEQIIQIFQHVIALVEKYNEFHDMGFWAYSHIANLYLYRLLSGEEALVHAMKNYNQAYRFSQEYDINVHDDFIFTDLEILENILMNQYPLLVVIYNHTGISLYEYLFQFVEVITQEQRFIPNFTALLSVVDERMHELFNSPISSAYLVIENRLMVMTTLYDENKMNWVKIAFIFSYLQQDSDDVEINNEILKKVRHFKHRVLETKEVADHLINFNGRHDTDIHLKIEELLQETFAS